MLFKESTSISAQYKPSRFNRREFPLILMRLHNVTLGAHVHFQCIRQKNNPYSGL